MNANKEEGTTDSSRLLPLSGMRRAMENRRFDEEGFPTVRQARPELINSEEILDRIEEVTRNTLVTLPASAKRSGDGSTPQPGIPICYTPKRVQKTKF